MRIAVYAPSAPLEGDVVVVPPGLTAPAAAESLEALRAFARGGGRVLALGDAVSLLCAADLLPGCVTAAPAGEPATHVRVEGRATPFTWAIPAGRIVALERAAAEHRWVADDADVAVLAAAGRVVLSYCDGAGGLPRHGTGTHAARVAGLCDESGRVVGVLGGLTEALDGPLGRQIAACLARV